MLAAHISVINEGGSARRLDRPPCVPGKTINIDVSFSGPFAQIEAWIRAHFDRFRPLRERWRTAGEATKIILVLAATAIAVMYVLRGGLLAPPHEAYSKVTSDLAQSPEEQTATSQQKAIEPNKAEHKLLPTEIRIAMLVGGPVAISVFALYLVFKRRKICRISIILLQPHEPFPAFDRDISRERWHFVFAIRVLGSDVYKTYFEYYRANSRSTSKIHSLHVTHAGFLADFFRPPHHINPQSYWALIRYAIGLRLWKGGEAEKYKITALLHQTLLGAYAVLLVGCRWTTAS